MTNEERVQELERDQKMLATVIRNAAIAIGDLPDDWEGSVDEAVTLMNRNIELVQARIAELEREVADYESSFALYDTAQRALNDAYAAAHPEPPSTLTRVLMHDTGKVSRWAADRLQELEREVARLKAHPVTAACLNRTCPICLERAERLAKGT